jgi:hypothetical protein
MRITTAIKTFQDVSKALKAGEEISNPERWKENQQTVNSLYLILLGIVAVVRLKYPELMFPDEYLVLIAGAGASFLAAFNRIMTAITTKKIGIMSRKGL